MRKLLLLAAPLLLAQAPPPSLVNTSADDIAANAPGAHWLDINPDHIMVMDSAAGRMVIPANTVHLGYRLDPMAIGRAATTKFNANMGASPVSSASSR